MAPIDDDTNFTVLYQRLIENRGFRFTPRDGAELWLENKGKNVYCTTERVAFYSFVKGYYPSYSAIYKKPYREWIVVQIRGDYFRYINPGDPAAAAEMAWMGVSIFHTKNGIYGEGKNRNSICTVVQQGMDTDCNGETVDSVLGMANGIENAEPQWIAPLMVCRKPVFSVWVRLALKHW